MADAVLTINAGSSSLKFSVYRDRRARPAGAGGQGPGRGHRHRAAPRRRGRRGQVLVERRWPDDPAQATTSSSASSAAGCASISATGRRCSASAIASCMAAPSSPRRCASRPAVLARLEALCPLAPLASAAQSRRHPRGRRGPARPAAGGLLRHRVPPRPSRARRLVRPAAPVLRRGHPPLRLPRPVLRVHRERAARGRAGDCRGPRGGRPSRQRRQHVRDQGRPQPWTAPWASPRSTACPWARAAARSIRASCCI